MNKNPAENEFQELLDCPVKRCSMPPVNACFYRAWHFRLYYPKMAFVRACCVQTLEGKAIFFILIPWLSALSFIIL
ncbi:hypothetical protein DWY22_00270 [Heyndrickxia coagulans]|nr:hypothetical protein DWY22_00270 [Heyndrickxia coagulans]RGS00755.1 hypothetical protein DWY16_00350 [Heyndrickxia coagulans]